MDYEYWSVHEARLWFGNIFLALVADVRQLYQIYERELKLRVQYSLAAAGSDKNQIVDELRQQDLKRRGVLLDLYRNLLDVPLAINALSAQPRFSHFLLSTLGLLSSFIGCVQSWPSAAPKQ